MLETDSEPDADGDDAAAVGDDELLDVIRRMRALWESATPEERAELLALIEDVLGPAPDVN